MYIIKKLYKKYRLTKQKKYSPSTQKYNTILIYLVLNKKTEK